MKSNEQRSKSQLLFLNHFIIKTPMIFPTPALDNKIPISLDLRQYLGHIKVNFKVNFFHCASKLI